jgi:hypothetical protein
MRHHDAGRLTAVERLRRMPLALPDENLPDVREQR